MKHLGIVLMALIVISCGKNSSGGSNSPTGYINPVVSEDASKDELFKLINKQRQAARVQRLQRMDMMDMEADMHAQDMADNRVAYGHFGVNERCMRARRSIGGGSICGEMIARDEQNAQAAMDSWQMRNGTRFQLTDPRFNRIGIGVGSDRFGRVYWTIILLQQ
jgi:uncharacterized protein YkwD